MNSRVLGIIPARLASTRLPKKPLFPLLGRPLVEWVWERVHAIPQLDTVVVATDRWRGGKPTRTTRSS
jgi:3-deoxy-manno-octulosonate cytidylyltransferase (CMP-KDO synthetase)